MSRCTNDTSLMQLVNKVHNITSVLWLSICHIIIKIDRLRRICYTECTYATPTKTPKLHLRCYTCDSFYSNCSNCLIHACTEACGVARQRHVGNDVTQQPGNRCYGSGDAKVTCSTDTRRPAATESGPT